MNKKEFINKYDKAVRCFTSQELLDDLDTLLKEHSQGGYSKEDMENSMLYASIHKLNTTEIENYIKKLNSLHPISNQETKEHECKFYVNANWTGYSRCECKW